MLCPVLITYIQELHAKNNANSISSFYDSNPKKEFWQIHTDILI